MIDLHMHSENSDGLNTPKQLLQIARKMNLNTISITDHHTWAAHYKPSEDTDIEVLTGTELTAKSKGTSLHFLCHGFDVQSLDLHVEGIFGSKKERRKQYLGAIRLKGIIIPETEEERMLELPYGFHKHLAQYIMNNQIYDRKEMFSVISHVYAEMFTFTFNQARSVIQNSGGVIGLAHPLLKLNGHNLTDTIYKLADNGMDTLEVWHPHNAQQGKIKELYNLSKECNLIPIGGSDLHDDEKYVGVCFTPFEHYYRLKNLLEHQGKASQQTQA